MVEGGDTLASRKAHFWSGKRVFLTGHTGFKGAWMSAMLHQLGAEVHGYALPPLSPSLYESSGGECWMASSTYADIGDCDAVSRALVQSKPDIVFHLAAQALVRPSYVAPVKTFETNVMGTVHLLEACRAVDHPVSVVIVTTDKCYENQEWIWGYREHEPMGGRDPYSASKACAELVTAAYRHSFASTGSNLRIASARAGNVVGGGDWATDRLVPDLIRGFLKDESVAIRSPNATRPWQHVLEPVDAYLRLAERLASDEGERFASAWNFGPGTQGEQQVSTVADMMTATWGDGAAWHIHSDAILHEATALRLDISKARMQLGWAPMLTLSDTVNMTVDWYKATAYGENSREWTNKQVRDYLVARAAKELIDGRKGNKA